MIQPKLMRCPFCGGSSQLIDSYEGFFVICNDCGSMSLVKRSSAAAVKSWNTRFINGLRMVYYWKDNGFTVITDAAAASSNGKAVKHG